MLLLLVDTAGVTGGVLLARGESDVSTQQETEILGSRILAPREFSVQMIPAIGELLQAEKLGLSDIDLHGVVAGPGSFTGLRVGLSAVKAMAEVTAKPIVALSRLAVMASVAGRSKPREDAAEPVHVVLDAGRGEFYHGIYCDSGWTCVNESLETLPSLIASLESVRGELIAFEPPVLIALAHFYPRQIPDLTVKDALSLAFAAWHASRFTDVALLDANYLRRMIPEVRHKPFSPNSAADAL